MAPRKKTSKAVVTAADVPAPAASGSGKTTGRRYIRGKRGGLKDMPSMPLDLLLEIFAHFLPADLLAMARTTKDFRAFLMSRQSASCWRAARRNMDGLPDCPPYLSEPAYANLLFSSYCHECSKPNTKTVIWTFLARYCPKCRSLMMFDRFRLGNYVPRQLAALVPRSPVLTYIVLDDRRWPKIQYHVPDGEKLMRDWNALAGDEDKQLQFAKDTVARVEHLEKFAESCERWHRARVAARGDELQKLKELRLSAIVTKLSELGYDRELRDMEDTRYSPLAYHPAVKQPKLLTQRAWDGMSESVIALMDKCRQALIDADRRNMLRERLQNILPVISSFYLKSKKTSESEYLPTFADFALMPEIRAIVEADTATEDTKDDFSEVSDILPDLAERWQEDTEAYFAGLVASEIVNRDIPEGVNALDLATTIFTCRHCHVCLSYPNILAHRCPPYTYLDRRKGDLYEDVVFLFDRQNFRQNYRSILDIELVNERYPRIANLIAAAGKDPAQTTIHEMDALDGRYRCEICDARDADLIWTSYTWRAALVHMETSTYSLFHEKASWVEVTGKEREEAENLEHSALKTSLLSHHQQDVWCCAHCNEDEAHRKPMINVQEHSRIIHSIQDASDETGDIYLTPSNTFRLSPILLDQDAKFKTPSTTRRLLLNADWMPGYR